MDTYIVRQPILQNKDGNKVVAYEILYKEDENALYNQRDTRVANAIEQFLGELSGDKFLDGKVAFLTFTPNLLMKNIPKMFSPEKLVIQIDDSSIIHPVAQKIIYRYKKQGYRIAVVDFEFSPRYFGIMDTVDYIKVNFDGLDSTHPTNASIVNRINIAHSLQKQIVAYKVNTPEALSLAKEMGCELIQGSCVAEQTQSKVQRVDHMQSNFFQLMVAVTKDEPDVDEISRIISRDVTLAFSLMKLVNSAYFALRNQAKSVQQALVVLGLGQLKQWIYLLSFKRDNGGVSDELIKTSFLRATFCMELTKNLSDFPISPAEAYMMGMFSTLGDLMEVPLELALEELPISEHVKSALLTHEGRCGTLYQMVLCYENANWGEMTWHAKLLNLPMNIITQTYFECVESVNNIWQGLTNQASQEDVEEKDPGLSDMLQAMKDSQ